MDRQEMSTALSKLVLDDSLACEVRMFAVALSGRVDHTNEGSEEWGLIVAFLEQRLHAKVAPHPLNPDLHIWEIERKRPAMELIQ